MNPIVSPSPDRVVVQFLGTARERAQRDDLEATGQTVAQLLDFVERTCPALQGLLNEDGSISRRFLISLNGSTFIDDPATILAPGSRMQIRGVDSRG